MTQSFFNAGIESRSLEFQRITGLPAADRALRAAELTCLGCEAIVDQATLPFNDVTRNDG